MPAPPLVSLLGLAGALSGLEKIRGDVMTLRVYGTMSYAMSILKTAAKVGYKHVPKAPYADITGALRNSVDFDVEIVGKGKVVGYLFAGEEYAVYVEFMQGYWVLAGAIYGLREEIGTLIGKELQVASMVSGKRLTGASVDAALEQGAGHMTVKRAAR